MYNLVVEGFESEEQVRAFWSAYANHFEQFFPEHWEETLGKVTMYSSLCPAKVENNVLYARVNVRKWD